MDPNPYSPPQAVVADARPETAREIQRPITVRIAIWLLWLSLGLFVLALLIKFKAGAMPSGTLNVAIAVTVGNVAISTWLNLKIAAGRNWARIVWIALFLMGGLLVAAIFLTALKDYPINPLILAQSFLSVIAAILLLTPSAGLWFTQNHRAHQ